MAIFVALPLFLASCEDILGEWDRPTPAVVTPSEPETPPTPEEIIYAFSLRNLADDADVAADALKVTDQAGTEIASATSDGKYTIKKDDLGSATMLWLEAITATGKCIQKVKIEDLPAIAEAGKLTMATLGNVIGADGKFYADKAAVDAASTTGVAMIVYLGNEGESSTKYNRGLAIALSDASTGAKWGPGGDAGLTKYTTWCSTTPAASDANTDMAGLANTATLVTKAGTDANYQAGKAAADYKNTVAAPAGFSDWFLPSAGQWYKFLNGMYGFTWTIYGSAGGTDSDNYNTANKAFVDAGYDTAPNDARFGSGSAVYYWSSSTNGVYVHYGTKSNNNRVRSFLAF